MTQNITRRDLFQRLAFTLPAGTLVLMATGCGQSQADQFIAISGEIVAGVQGALPIIQLFVPPPYNLLEPELATFINLANTAAINIANAAAANGTALALTQVIIQQLENIVLSPSVLAALPTNFIGPNGPVNVQALFTALIQLANNELALAAHAAGATVVPNPANVINSTALAPVAAKTALASTQVKMTGAQMKKINAMLEQAKRNAAVMLALPSADTIRRNNALGK